MHLNSFRKIVRTSIRTEAFVYIWLLFIQPIDWESVVCDSDSCVATNHTNDFHDLLYSKMEM